MIRAPHFSLPQIIHFDERTTDAFPTLKFQPYAKGTEVVVESMAVVGVVWCSCRGGGVVS